MALGKALSTARGLSGGLVLGADTIVYCRGRILGKPSSLRQAETMLRRLSGTWHSVYTGLALVAVPDDRRWQVVWESRVKMRPLSPDEIVFWARKNRDKAGGYAVQEKKDTLIVEIRGDYDNVVGLPLRGVKKLLRRARQNGYAPSPRRSHLSMKT